MLSGQSSNQNRKGVITIGVIINKWANKYSKEWHKLYERAFDAHFETISASDHDDIQNFSDLSYDDKLRVARSDFNEMIQAVYMYHEYVASGDNVIDMYGCPLLKKSEVIKDLELIMQPIRKGNVLYYSRVLKDYRLLRDDAKAPIDIFLEMKFFDDKATAESVSEAIADIYFEE